MVDLNRLIADINTLRESLYSVIQQKNENLLDPDVQSACKSLNTAINEYIRSFENQA